MNLTWTEAVRAVLRPAPNALAWRPALWAVGAAGVIALVGATTGHLVEVGLAYFGAACAAIFVTSGVYRTRALALVLQALGAAAGFAAGAVAGDSIPGRVAVATAVALVAGMIGAIGRLTTAFALMAVIGVAFVQFSGLNTPWWEQAAWYAVGTAAVGLPAVAPWIVRRDRFEWTAIADVFEASARLLVVIGPVDARAARQDLAAASARSREAVRDHRIGLRWLRTSRRSQLIVGYARSEEVALAAARFYADSITLSRSVVAAVEAAAADARCRRSPDESLTRAGDALGIDWHRVSEPTRPPSVRFAAAARIATDRPARTAGLRLAVCMGVATVVTAALHTESHSFWLPLTVAVVVRPEYASVFNRTVNRFVGTVLGALVAAVLLLVLHRGWPVAVAAAAALGVAVLVAPRLYGLSVIGVTGSALLSACIGRADPVYPLLRLTDTALGCAIALIFGYLLWPGRSALPDRVRMDDAVEAGIEYLTQAARPPAQRANWNAVRDRAYRSAHESRAAVQAGLLEPPPVNVLSRQALPEAIALEDVADRTTALARRVEAGATIDPHELQQRITQLRQLA